MEGFNKKKAGVRERTTKEKKGLFVDQDIFFRG